MVTVELVRAGRSVPGALSVVRGGVEYRVGYVWRQEAPPAGGTTYRWTGTPHASPSERVVDGDVEATNLVPDPRGRGDLAGWNLSQADAAYDPERDAIRVRATAGQSSPYVALALSNALEDVTVAAQVWTSDGGPAQMAVYQNRAEPPGTATRGVASGEAIRWYHSSSSGSGSSYIWRVPLLGDRTVWLRAMVVSGDYTGAWFDGDTPGDRANDLWIDTTGTLHVHDQTTGRWARY